MSNPFYMVCNDLSHIHFHTVPSSWLAGWLDHVSHQTGMSTALVLRNDAADTYHIMSNDHPGQLAVHSITVTSMPLCTDLIQHSQDTFVEVLDIGASVYATTAAGLSSNRQVQYIAAVPVSFLRDRVGVLCAIHDQHADAMHAHSQHVMRECARTLTRRMEDPEIPMIQRQNVTR